MAKLGSVKSRIPAPDMPVLDVGQSLMQSTVQDPNLQVCFEKHGRQFALNVSLRIKVTAHSHVKTSTYLCPKVATCWQSVRHILKY